jgi:arsenate reductase
MEKTKVVFVYVHNSCLSQIAEALGKQIAGDTLACYSAGTHIKDQINQAAARLMKDLYNIDMEEKQYSKIITDIPEVDIILTMGCNVYCPTLPCKFREDWGLDDPTGKSDEDFIEVIKNIESKIIQLKNTHYMLVDS